MPVDEIGREYLLVALSIGELEDGIVDSYYGPPELREQARARKAGADVLAAEAAALRSRVASTVSGQRGLWLGGQLLSLETLARRLAGEQIPYLEEVEGCFDARPERTPAEQYARVRRDLDALLPAGGDLRERLETRDTRLTVPTEQLESIVEWLVPAIRDLCATAFAVPDGDSLTVSLVTDEPWAAYNWYDGGLRSRIEINTDLPTRAQNLVGILTHETFPGHHLEHSWKETRLYREGGLAEASVQLINTPEAYISEGLAEVGGRLLVDSATWQSLLMEICERAGIALSPADAEREWQIDQALHALRGAGGDAALLLHAEGRSRDEVVRFLIDDALRGPEQAEKSMQFITHPLWRTYVFCYAGGGTLLTAWCAAAGALSAQCERFFRLLTEQLTPSAIQRELSSSNLTP